MPLVLRDAREFHFPAAVALAAAFFSPFGQKPAVRIEFLDATILPVADINIARLIHGNAFRHIELTFVGAFATPAFYEFALTLPLATPGS